METPEDEVPRPLYYADVPVDIRLPGAKDLDLAPITDEERAAFDVGREEFAREMKKIHDEGVKYLGPSITD